MIYLVTQYRLSLIVPVIVVLLETQVALRPWVKRTVRLGAGLTFAAMLLSYSLTVWSTVPYR